MIDLVVDRARLDFAKPIGTRVRALLKGHEVAVDIATLDLPSLRAWLRQHGGENLFAETQFALLLGHDLQEIGKAWLP